MRGHGVTVVGGSLQQAVFRAIYTKVNAELQLLASSLGPITFLSTAEAVAATAATDGQRPPTLFGQWFPYLKVIPSV